jgi:hypothetical protein
MAWLRGRARRRRPPGTLALLPDPLRPWRWLGCRRAGATMELFRVDGDVHGEAAVPLLDDSDVAALPEFRRMRELSNAYHVTERNDNRIVCRDLRTRSFGARFGTLEVAIEEDGTPRVLRFTASASPGPMRWCSRSAWRRRGCCSRTERPSPGCRRWSSATSSSSATCSEGQEFCEWTDAPFQAGRI